MNIFDIILIKFPGIEGVSYWHAQYDGSPWDDPYDGLVWENKTIQKPTKEEIQEWSNDLQFQWNLNTFYKKAQEFIADYINKIAQSRGYDSTLSISTYSNSTIPAWRAESETFIAWRDLVLSQAYEYFYEVAQGMHPIPNMQEIEAMIPSIKWPE